MCVRACGVCVCVCVCLCVCVCVVWFACSVHGCTMCKLCVRIRVGGAEFAHYHHHDTAGYLHHFSAPLTGVHCRRPSPSSYLLDLPAAANSSPQCLLSVFLATDTTTSRYSGKWRMSWHARSSMDVGRGGGEGAAADASAAAAEVGWLAVEAGEALLLLAAALAAAAGVGGCAACFAFKALLPSALSLRRLRAPWLEAAQHRGVVGGRGGRQAGEGARADGGSGDRLAGGTGTVTSTFKTHVHLVHPLFWFVTCSSHCTPRPSHLLTYPLPLFLSSAYPLSLSIPPVHAHSLCL